jgi:hypothetical protein
MKSASKITPQKPRSRILRVFTWPGVVSNVISSLSMVIAGLALVFSISSSENAVRPLLYIDVGDSHSPASCFGLFLRNNGMGPARIKAVGVYFDGRLIPRPSDMQMVILKEGFAGKPVDFQILSVPISVGMVIGAGQEILLFASSKSQITDPTVFDSLLRRLSIHISYSSVSSYNYEVHFGRQDQPRG